MHPSSSEVENAQAQKRLQLPSFKHTFASILSYSRDTEEEAFDHELSSQQPQSPPPKREYELIPDNTRYVTGKMTQMPTPAKFATMRDDLERGYGRF